MDFSETFCLMVIIAIIGNPLQIKLFACKAELEYPIGLLYKGLICRNPVRLVFLFRTCVRRLGDKFISCSFSLDSCVISLTLSL